MIYEYVAPVLLPRGAKYCSLLLIKEKRTVSAFHLALFNED